MNYFGKRKLDTSHIFFSLFNLNSLMAGSPCWGRCQLLRSLPTYNLLQAIRSGSWSDEPVTQTATDSFQSDTSEVYTLNRKVYKLMGNNLINTTNKDSHFPSQTKQLFLNLCIILFPFAAGSAS